MKNKLIDLDFVEKFMRMSDKQRSDLMIEFFGSVGYEINTVEYGSYTDNEFIPMIKYKVTPSMWLEELENIKKTSSKL